jgi:uncharacterized protein (DUF2336 family)
MNSKKYDHFFEALYVVFLAFCLVLLSSCAHDPKLEKKIDAEAQALPVENFEARKAEGVKAVEASPLSEKTKARLNELIETAGVDLKKLRDDQAKLRLLLVKKMLDEQASDREVDTIKQKILETNRQENKRWLKALEEARNVIGRKSIHDMRYYRAFMQDSTAVQRE